MLSFKTVIKGLLSLVLLSYLIYIAEPSKILQETSNIWRDGGITYFICALIVFVIALFALAIRWRILILGYGLNTSVSSLFKFYLIGLFFNNFLPTGIGGDVLRIYNLIQDSGERTIGFASVLTERLLGVVSTLILALFSICVMYRDIENLLLLYIAIGLLISIVIFFIIIFNERLFKIIITLISKMKIFRLGERINKFLEAIHYYRDKKIIYVRVLLVTLSAQILLISMTYFLALSLKISVTPIYLFFVVPVIFLLTILPSINGIGFRDGGYVILLGKVGVSKAAALSLSFLTLFIPMVISIVGGILFLLQKRNTKLEEMKVVEEII